MPDRCPTRGPTSTSWIPATCDAGSAWSSNDPHRSPGPSPTTSPSAEIEARLALGQSSRDAARPYLRGVLRSALSPQIETTKATGLVFLPGAMTGLILAGVPPIQAVLVQAVVMFLVLAAAATTTSVVALGLVRRLFTADHRLVGLSRTA